MHLLLVDVNVKPDRVEAFLSATRANIQGSLKEPGVTRFELCQHDEDQARFVIIEGYVDETAILAHKETAHYKLWRDTVADMMAVPRKGTRFHPAP